MKAADLPESGGDREPRVPPHIAAEAAIWIARLHGPSRSAAMERDCLAWQAQSALHRLAFEGTTDVWEAVQGDRLAQAYALASDLAAHADARRTAGLRRWLAGWPALSVGAGVLAIAAFAVHQWWDVDVYATHVGEMQQVVLDDGTRISLNTDTRVRVDLDADVRSVEVVDGEALFEVAQDPKRPFVVRAAGSEVVALGTVFSVRIPGRGEAASDELAVTLIEGKVTVRTAGVTQGTVLADPVQMKPGERVRLLKANGAPDGVHRAQVDRPRIDQVIAWKRSEAIFDDVSLPQAVAEMNRYNRTPIVLLDGAAMSGLRISGQFRTGDSRSFARAVAVLHGLELRERDVRLELSVHR